MEPWGFEAAEDLSVFSWDLHRLRNASLMLALQLNGYNIDTSADVKGFQGSDHFVFWGWDPHVVSLACFSQETLVRVLVLSRTNSWLCFLGDKAVCVFLP